MYTLHVVTCIVCACQKVCYEEIVFLLQDYYKHKGSRSVTRNGQIQDSIESCLDVLIERCQHYRQQAEDYRNQCIDGQ